MKVGDRVKIKSYGWYKRNHKRVGCNDFVLLQHNDYFSEEMAEYCGKYAIIKRLGTDKYNDWFYLDIDNELHYWTIDMFDNMRKDKLLKLNTL
jgi:hypothetical protein